MVEIAFNGLRLHTRPGRVMTPRAASEALVGLAARRIGDRPARVADVGTGSGAIAVAIAVRAPRAWLWAVDVDAEAVRLTRANAALHGVGARVHAVAGDLLDPVPRGLDVVTANLPYLPDRLADDPAYAAYAGEPRGAIYAPGDGLGHYRRLLDQASGYLAPGGALVVQFRRRALLAERAAIPALRARLETLAAAASAP